jgi:hypothetical protein
MTLTLKLTASSHACPSTLIAWQDGGAADEEAKVDSALGR